MLSHFSRLLDADWCDDGFRTPILAIIRSRNWADLPLDTSETSLLQQSDLLVLNDFLLVAKVSKDTSFTQEASGILEEVPLMHVHSRRLERVCVIEDAIVTLSRQCRCNIPCKPLVDDC